MITGNKKKKLPCPYQRRPDYKWQPSSIFSILRQTCEHLTHKKANILDYNGQSEHGRESAYFNIFVVVLLCIWFLFFHNFFFFRLKLHLFRAFVSNWRCVYDAQANPHIIKYQNIESRCNFLFVYKKARAIWMRWDKISL